MISVLLIFLREFTEAVAGCMILSNKPENRRQVWLGAALAIAVSIAGGVGLHQLVKKADKAWTPLEGALAVLAAFFLLGLGAYHLMRRRWLPKRSHEASPTEGSTKPTLRLKSVGIVAFFLCIREGGEFVLFSLEHTWVQVLLAIVLGTAILALPLKLLGPKLMNQRYTNVMNWALIAFGVWLLINVREPAHKANWPGWLLPVFGAIYAIAAITIFVEWKRRRITKIP